MIIFKNNKGPKVFVLQQDLTIEFDMSEELLIPCQVSDPTANISLLLVRFIIIALHYIDVCLFFLERGSN